MARLSGLGKGLGALIPADAAAVGGEVARLEDLPVGSILPNPHPPRVHFDEETLAELSASARSDWSPGSDAGGPRDERACS